MTKIAVVGSMNMDVIISVDQHPIIGETLKGKSTAYSPGGKGANQAVAASLAGGDVSMIGAVGEDAFAEQLLASLRAFHVDTQSVVSKTGTSGLAFITVNASGENSIIISEGANGKISKADIDDQRHVIEGAQAVLLQNEIPWEVTQYVIELANQQGVKVYVNPAPAVLVPDHVLKLVDVLVLNESETEMITGITVSSMDHASKAAKQLIEKGVGSVIVTMGHEGSLYMNQKGNAHFTAAFKVKAVDTTAAGDTFIGAFAVAHESGKSIEDALRFASAAAAIAVTRKGAQVSIPSKEEIDAFVEKHSL